MKRLLLLLFVLISLPAGAVPWQGFTALAASPDGRWLATGGRAGQILWIDAASGEMAQSWTLPGTGPVVGLAFEPSGKLAAVTLDGTAQELTLGQAAPAASVAPATLGLGHAPERWLSSSAVVFGVRVISGEFWAEGRPDGTISVGVASGQTLVSWHAHDAAVTGLVLAAGVLFSASYDGSLRRWDARTGTLLGSL